MEDTISAIATAPGEGGIGIIRISGDQAYPILIKLFKSSNSNNESPIVDRRLTYGHIYDPATLKVVDEVMAVYMKAPHTYTKEDVVEIQCHGSIVSLARILDLTLQEGARLAEPGEFTKRAFLNGRIDLSQAEAVIDLIEAKADRTFDSALSQLGGSLSLKIRGFRDRLMDVLVKLAVNIDYPDEDIEVLAYEELIRDLETLSRDLALLIETAKTGKIISQGLKITIAGKPNVGKSSLLNALLREERVIVTEFPGTTRDTIEERLSLDGIPVYLTDTAGIRDTDDPIELMGIERSHTSFARADLVVFMVDGSQKLDQEDLEIAEKIKDKKVIVLINKQDLGKVVTEENLIDILPEAKFINASVLEEKGIFELEDKIKDLVYGGLLHAENQDIITNLRHKDLLDKAKQSVDEGLHMARDFAAMDFIEVDVRNAWVYLGDIIGESISEDIIDEIFQRFCLGK